MKTAVHKQPPLENSVIPTILPIRFPVPVSCNQCGEESHIHAGQLASGYRFNCLQCLHEWILSEADVRIIHTILARAGFHLSGNAKQR